MGEQIRKTFLPRLRRTSSKSLPSREREIGHFGSRPESGTAGRTNGGERGENTGQEPCRRPLPAFLVPPRVCLPHYSYLKTLNQRPTVFWRRATRHYAPENFILDLPSHAWSTRAPHSASISPAGRFGFQFQIKVCRSSLPRSLTLTPVSSPRASPVRSVYDKLVQEDRLNCKQIASPGISQTQSMMTIANSICIMLFRVGVCGGNSPNYINIFFTR